MIAKLADSSGTVRKNRVVVGFVYVAQDLLSSLQPHLAVFTDSACTSGIPEPSHVLPALGLTPAQSDASIRFSFGRFTTDAEIEEAVNLVVKCLESNVGADPDRRIA